MDQLVQPLITTLVCMLGCYLVCGIPFGLIIGRLQGNIDIRTAGSGNIGTTNALRVAGPKVAGLTLLFDCLKGVLGVVVGRWAISALGFGLDPSIVAAGAPGDWMIALVGLSCLYGHIFSPYLKFKGGKGIATGVGVLFGFFWPLALVHLGIFIVIVATTRLVSLGSVITAALVPLTMHLAFPQMSAASLAIWAILGFTVVWAHRSNIKRLIARTEPKISMGKRAEGLDGER
ncbi:MAG: glycerol-3-phosphate 1-O-acyltransferase PlsY [Collinsella sp.]|nr:glycerol-3-phosphate 1-O-acyltransferase PlsY [Collinsella sp.]